MSHLRSSLLSPLRAHFWIAPLLIVGATAAVAATPVATAPPAAEPAAAPVVTVADYVLDPSKSQIYVQVYKDPDTLAAGLSHDHVIAATGWNGKVTWDTANIAACKVTISVPTSGLVNDEDSLRKKVGYDTVLDSGDRAEVKEHMLGSDQLNAGSFPNLTFTSTSCAASGTSTVVKGNMSLHGVSKAVSVTMAITADGKSFGAKGTLALGQTDFGITPFSALFGQLKNKNEMKFTIDVKGAAK
ncbi:MAG: YceI family protein [Myxococcales bacterium]|nr:YceI family protein [Myxococcales bacterium]